ncbi:sulfotransferase 1E1-like [Mercenaria mercenaria]|uniref:sulfotransferase 1E1-like n=1 Tax=Mercenaria mercenaria TaxID=6596 RepID=UPI00234F1EBA|nr:sulfotransferase 1E1-like [Mercenaria mercenaria]
MAEVILTDADGNTLRSGIDVGGIITPDPYLDPVRNKLIYDDLQNFKFRDDDIMLCTFLKSGTHWMYEILSMINNRSSERIKSFKFMSMIECQTQEYIDTLQSPRVLNSHVRPSLLPKGLGQRKIKTILCLRNPKDIAVSLYHHIVGLRHYGYTGTFDAWLPLYLEGKLEDGRYTDYLLEWEKAITEGMDFPLHLMFYEDLKLDTENELNKLLKFLDIELDMTLKNSIIDACSFEKMTKEKELVSKELSEKIIRGGFNFFRKGKIGDWKNLFTVAQNKMFDEIWNKQMNNSTMFNFLYTPPSPSVKNC